MIKVWEDQQPDRAKRFIEAWESGVKHSDISVRFGISQSTIYGILKRLGLPKRQNQQHKGRRHAARC
jgi:transposase